MSKWHGCPPFFTIFLLYLKAGNFFFIRYSNQFLSFSFSLSLDNFAFFLVMTSKINAIYKSHKTKMYSKALQVKTTYYFRPWSWGARRPTSPHHASCTPPGRPTWPWANSTTTVQCPTKNWSKSWKLSKADSTDLWPYQKRSCILTWTILQVKTLLGERVTWGWDQTEWLCKMLLHRWPCCNLFPLACLRLQCPPRSTVITWFRYT